MLQCGVVPGWRRFRSGFGWFRGGWSLSVAAFWAGAAHPRRQKLREMPPPGASAPAFAATVEPLSSPCPCKISKARRELRRAMERVLGDVLLRASILDFRAKLENRCKVLPVYALLRASILDFMPRLANRCKYFPENNLLRAVILDFRPKLENRCRVLPVYALLRASILDFRARLVNLCKVFPVYTLFRASILDFVPRLRNRCSAISATVRNGSACSGRGGDEVRVRF